MINLDKAKRILKENNYTFVLLTDGKIAKTSYKKGIIPFMEAIRDNYTLLEGVVVADKVIGKAAALLAANSKITGIYTEIISRKAKEILEYYSILYQYEKCVDYIQNRSKDDQCPMEKLTQGIRDPKIAYLRILQYYNEVLKIDLS